jgi:hypothetical protein
VWVCGCVGVWVCGCVGVGVGVCVCVCVCVCASPWTKLIVPGLPPLSCICVVKLCSNVATVFV